MSQAEEIKRLASGLLNRDLGPIQPYIIMKDLLDTPRDDNLLRETEERATGSKWVRELEEAQEPNGSWGRFHSMDSRLKKKYPTTERAIHRALCLGLDKESPVLGRAVAYMVRVMDGRDCWPDRMEKSNEWPVMMKQFTAATLSRVDGQHPCLNTVRQTWAAIATRAFETGEHNLHSERAAFEELTGMEWSGTDSKLNKMYPLVLLGSTQSVLPQKVERAYLEWLWHLEDGIYYLTGFPMNGLPEITSRDFPLWLRTLDLFAGYHYGKHLISNAMEYIWSLRDREGLWDFGAGSRGALCARTYLGWQLADSWKNGESRKIDATVRVLLLFKKCYPTVKDNLKHM